MERSERIIHWTLEEHFTLRDMMPIPEQSCEHLDGRLVSTLDYDVDGCGYNLCSWLALQRLHEFKIMPIGLLQDFSAMSFEVTN